MALEERSKRAPDRDGPTPDLAPPEDAADDRDAAEIEEEKHYLQAARGGDHDAFRWLVERNQDRIFRYLRRMLRCDRDTAADLTQEVFLRMHRGLSGFDGRAKFTTWLYKIATNVGISRYRHLRAQKRSKWTFSLDAPMPGTDDLAPDPAAPAVEDPAQRAHHREIAAAVREAVQDLPDEFREAVILRDLEGLSYEEIGELTGVPPGTVRSRIHRGRLLLQDKLREFN